MKVITIDSQRALVGERVGVSSLLYRPTLILMLNSVTVVLKSVKPIIKLYYARPMYSRIIDLTGVYMRWAYY